MGDLKTAMMYQRVVEFFGQTPGFSDFTCLYRKDWAPERMADEVNWIFADQIGILLFNFMTETILFEQLTKYQIGDEVEGPDDAVAERSYCILGLRDGLPEFGHFSPDEKAMEPHWRELAAVLPSADPSKTALSPEFSTAKIPRTVVAATIGTLEDGRQVRHFYHHPLLTAGQAGSCIRGFVQLMMPLRS